MPYSLSTPLSDALSTKKEYLEALKEMEVRTVEDLLLYFPRTYEDLSNFKNLHETKDGEIVTVKGRLHGLALARTKNPRVKLTKALFYDAMGNAAEVVWFNQPHLARMIPMDTDVILSGKVQFAYGRFTIQSPEVETVKEAQIHTGVLVPIYPQHEVITAKWLRTKIHPLLYVCKEFAEILPAEVVEAEQLMPRSEAIRELHFPSSVEALERAKDRMAYEELFLLQVKAVKAKKQWQESRTDGEKGVMLMDPEWVKGFFGTLPFVPTGAQKVAIYEILKDMEKPFPMMRLLEGDVGSGKTMVAAITLIHAIKHGFQTAIMAPTEVLARQHMQSMSRFVENYEKGFGPGASGGRPINVGLLLGSLSAPEKRKVQQGIANGQVDLVVGTHALIQEEVKFANLGLVVVDEQHRFGVMQREALIKQGSPHVLNMTATPIPRTLAIVAYGDQDLSVLGELPPGRKPIETRIVPPEDRTTVYRFIEGKLKAGQQAYVICPLIESSGKAEMIEVKSVKAAHAHLTEVFKGYKVAMLHGRMKSEEKEEVMRAFKDRESDILVSTSVIEVGVDVPNSTIMVIEGADRFGLSQLHQFRGRVGRGQEKSYCFLFANAGSEDTYARLKAMVDFTDGFKLAEIDLKLRGPGEVYGVRQSGMPDLKFANFMNGVLLSRVRKAAEIFVEKIA
jgi:ATP-dependent DNA helicase RecG